MAYVSYRIFSVNVKAPLFIAQVGLIIYTIFAAWFLEVTGATLISYYAVFQFYSSINDFGPILIKRPCYVTRLWLKR